MSLPRKVKHVLKELLPPPPPKIFRSLVPPPPYPRD